MKAIKNFKDGLLNGACYWFFSNGKLEQNVTYINGEAEGHAYFFYKSGALKSRRLYLNGKPVGYAENYFDHSTGIIHSIFKFNEDGRLVYKREFDSSGKVIKEEGKY